MNVLTEQLQKEKAELIEKIKEEIKIRKGDILSDNAWVFSSKEIYDILDTFKNHSRLIRKNDNPQDDCTISGRESCPVVSNSSGCGKEVYGGVKSYDEEGNIIDRIWNYCGSKGYYCPECQARDKNGS